MSRWIHILCAHLVLLIGYSSNSLAGPLDGSVLRLELVAAEYAKWLIETGVSEPSKGWKLEVDNLTRLECQPKEDQCLRFVLSIGFQHPEKTWHNAPDGWEVINKQFSASEGASLDERLLFKLAHVLGVRVESVTFQMDTGCISWSRRIVKGQVRKIPGFVCAMASSRTIITTESNPALGDLLADAATEQIQNHNVRGETISAFFDEYYALRQAILRKVVIEDHYVEVYISGLHGEVIQEQPYWEHLQSSIVVAVHGSYIELRILLDGKYAAGLTRPPLTGYSDMEPAHSKSLQIYAGQLLSALKMFIVEQ